MAAAVRLLILGALLVVVAHFSGLLQPVEEKVAPSLTQYSADWLGDVFRDTASKAAKHVLEDQLSGSEPQRVAAKAACAALDADLPDKADSAQISAAINAHLSKSQAADPEVTAAVKSLAPKLAALKDIKPLLRTVCS